MKKSIGSLVAAVLTVTLILTGCGGGDKSSSSSASSDDTSNTLRLATNEEHINYLEDLGKELL